MAAMVAILNSSNDIPQDVGRIEVKLDRRHHSDIENQNC